MYFHIFSKRISIEEWKTNLSVAFNIFRKNSSVCEPLFILSAPCSKCSVYYIQLIHRLNWLLCFSFAIEHSPIRLTHVFFWAFLYPLSNQMEHICIHVYLFVYIALHIVLYLYSVHHHIVKWNFFQSPLFLMTFWIEILCERIFV